jgi:hypothetical protein
MGYEALVEDKTRHLRLLEITPDLVLDLLKVNEDRKADTQRMLAAQRAR